MKQNRLLEDPVRSVFLSYLVPSVSATLVTSIYILADTMMIGRGIGSVGIAALNILLPLYSTFFGFGMMCGIGGSVLFGFSRGKGNEREARGYFTTGLPMALVFAVPTRPSAMCFFDPLLRLLGVTPAMREHAVAYGRVLVTASPMCVMSSFLQAFVRNDGAPKLAMAGVISGGVTNVILDYVFIFIMKWGMGGAMLATATGTTTTVLILSSHFFSKENHLKPLWNVSLKRCWRSLGNGLASFILEVSNGFVTFLFNRQLLAYVGDLGVVVYGIISNTALVVTSISNGMAQAVQPLLSANYGAGKRDQVRRGTGPGDPGGPGCGLDLYGVGIFLSHPAGVPVLEPTEEILSMAVPAIRLYFLAFLVSEWNIMCSTYFQSVVQPRRSPDHHASRGVVLNTALVMVLPVILGVNGIWLVVTVSEFITAAVAFLFIRRETH